MEPTAPTKRRWFQFHLSTCIVMMLAAGAVLWMNFHRPPEVWEPNHGHDLLFRYSGWPFARLDWIRDQPPMPWPPSPETDEAMRVFISQNPYGVFSGLSDILMNTVFGLALTITIGALFETLYIRKDHVLKSRIIRFAWRILVVWLVLNLTPLFWLQRLLPIDPLAESGFANFGWPVVFWMPSYFDEIGLPGLTGNMAFILIVSTWTALIMQRVAGKVDQRSEQPESP